MKKNQDEIFFQSEGDRWFLRNQAALKNGSKMNEDPVLRMLDQYTSFAPKNILEVGCSNGWRLRELHRRYQVPCLGVDPSEAALSDGRSAAPEVEFRRGTAAKLPIEKNQSFDLVIVFFVLHWVSRETLFASITEIDRVLAEGGLIVLGDFLPDYPAKRNYHHLPEKEVYTYKQDYAELLKASGLYIELSRSIFSVDHDNPLVANSDNRGVCSVLRKSLSQFYSSFTGERL